MFIRLMLYTFRAFVFRTLVLCTVHLLHRTWLLRFCMLRPAIIAITREVQYLRSSKNRGASGSVVVKALRYYSDCPGIDSRWCHWIFQ